MKLTLGGHGGMGKWGLPSPLYNFKTGQYETDGLIWYGRKPPMPKDYAMLDAKFGPKNYKVDGRSIVGRKDPLWTTFWHHNRRKENYFKQIVLGR